MNEELENRLTTHLHERADAAARWPDGLADARRRARRRSLQQRAAVGMGTLALMIGALVVAPLGEDEQALVTAAEADGEQAEDDGVEPRPAPVPKGESLLALFDVEDTERFSDDDRYLIDLLISPEDLPLPYRTNVVQSDDPNGNAEIGDRWYEPRLNIEACSFSTDQAPFPLVEAGYLPGDPAESELFSPFAAFGSPHQVGVRIELFDTREQRDAFASVMQQFYVAASEFECSVSDDATPSEFFAVELNQFEPTAVGYPGFGYTSGGPMGLSGETHRLQYWVGDRVLLTVTLTASPNSETELDITTLDPFVRLQVEKLVALGFG